MGPWKTLVLTLCSSDGQTDVSDVITLRHGVQGTALWVESSLFTFRIDIKEN